MKKLILGATGSIGSSLAKKVVSDGGEVHLVGRDKANLSKIASELNSTFTTCDVLEENFSEKIFNESLSVLVQINNKHLETTQKTLETNNIPFNIIGITTRKKTIKINDKINLLIK